MTTYSPVLELRQYTLHPGARDTLIELFDREFVETQEALGAEVIGQFRTPDDPDRFIWLRGYRDMAARAQALSAFYGGPVWKAHRTAANATMIDSDNVLLLRPASADTAFTLAGAARPGPGAHELPASTLAVTIYYLRAPAAAGFAEFFARAVQPTLTGAGGESLGRFVTDDTPNNFPALPVREGERVFVSFLDITKLASEGAHDAWLANSAGWRDGIAREMDSYLERAPERWRLAPTARSWLGAR